MILLQNLWSAEVRRLQSMISVSSVFMLLLAERSFLLQICCYDPVQFGGKALKMFVFLLKQCNMLVIVECEVPDILKWVVY